MHANYTRDIEDMHAYYTRCIEDTTHAGVECKQTISNDRRTGLI
jgi:hypothetical protein